MGLIFCAMGLLHALGLAVAFWLLRGAALNVRAAALARFYYFHFILLVAGSCAYLFIGYSRLGLFYIEPFLDFLVGLGEFILALIVMGLFIARGGLGGIFSLAPGAFLFAYGLGLVRGHPFGFGALPAAGNNGSS